MRGAWDDGRVKESMPPVVDVAAPVLAGGARDAVKSLFDRYVVPTYGRFDLVLSHGSGSEVWDVNGRRYLDLGGGIAVCSLGHAHPEVAAALAQQAQRLVHVSNLYYHEPQGRLAESLVGLMGGAGKVFFANSGASSSGGGGAALLSDKNPQFFSWEDAGRDCGDGAGEGEGGFWSDAGWIPVRCSF